MALKKRREKWVTYTKTEEGTVVTFDMLCCDNNYFLYIDDMFGQDCVRTKPWNCSQSGFID